MTGRVFESEGYWYCSVGGRIFGAWICREYALAGLQVELRRYERNRT